MFFVIMMNCIIPLTILVSFLNSLNAPELSKVFLLTYCVVALGFLIIINVTEILYRLRRRREKRREVLEYNPWWKVKEFGGWK